MTTFMKAAACEGRRPRHLAALRCHLRSDLVSRLLRDRQVARFVVAPDGFGKSSLAFGYAETVFSFKHVMWINGKSPCFLRDLDLGVLASGVRAVDERAALAVVDDLPPLTYERACALSAQIDDLLAGGCEVLVCCVPSCDAFGALQRDRIRLAATDLLLAEEEGERDGAEDGEGPAPRVAGLQQGSGLSTLAFLKGIAREELPAEMVLAMTVMLELREGSLDEVGAFGSCGEESLRLLAQDYPFLGIDERVGSFRTPWFDPGEIATAFSAKIDAAADRSHFSSRAGLARAVADALLARCEGRRACGLVGSLCSRDDRAAWLDQRRVALAKQACLLPASDLSRLLGRSAQTRSLALEADEAWRFVALGDEARACRHARRAVASKDESPQVMGLLVLVRHGTQKERVQAAARLAGWSAAPLPADAEKGAASRGLRWTRPLAGLSNLAGLPVDEARRRWASWRARGAHPDALTVAALWLFQDARRRAERPRSPKGSRAPHAGGTDALLLSDAAEHVAARVRGTGSHQPDAFASLAVLAWEGLRRAEALCGAADPLSDPLAARAAREVEASVLSQRRELENRRRARNRRRREYAATHPDAFLDGRYRPDAGAPAPRCPLLTVKLFGGLEVRIGDARVDPDKLRRQKVKTLLALLVLNRGRDVSRDRLMGMIWPEAEFDAARKNFYGIWSLLRTALSLPEGGCPYLIRQQNVCRLDGTLLRSDVADFDEACRTLMFGAMDTDGWARLSAEIDERFSDELMPGERSTDAIERMRSECRTNLVDALVAASRRLVSEGRAQEGLWFARKALRRDASREDAYTALMAAQVAAGQRAAALETYFACRRYLTEELGIDPSLETMALYRGIIEAEEGLA